MKTVVLIPCYNEAKTIENVINDFKKNMPHADIYVYDNNSSDGTADIAKKAGAIVKYEKKQGKGNVVRSMFRDIEADCYIMVDGDDTYPANFGPKLEKLVLDGADMAIGDRLSSTYFTENKRPFHNFGNVLVRKLTNLIFNGNVNDIMTGARAFSRDFVKSFAVLSKGFEIETEMTVFALRHNFAIAEIPVEYKDRPEGSESKLNTYSDGAKVIKTIAKLFAYNRPLSFFTIVSAILLIISACMFFPVFMDYLKTGMVAKYPTLIVSVGIATISMVNFFCGIILKVLKHNSEASFERQLTIIRCLKNNNDLKA